MKSKPPNTAAVTLKVTEGPSAGRVLQYTNHQTCILGRSKEAQLRLSPNRQFSRFHCRLEISPPEVAVVDLGSTNGTKVNGQRIETAMLATGDEVTVGDTKFTVTIQHSPEPSSSSHDATVIGVAMKRHTDHDSFDEPVPQIPGYTVERQIGFGSMGVVYVARRNATNEKVAIKIVRPLVCTHKKAIEKFRREAAIVLRLQHKRIVKSLDFRLTEDLLPYLVMEYIDEVDFRELLAAATLPDRCRMAAGIMVRVLEGLQYAHKLEIVHRDVKPTNLLVYKAGRKLQVKLADFGLAKNFIDAGFSDCSTSNEICGTLAYMPPEQIIDCRHAKPTCDIYAAGVCLYNMISGRLPFEADMVAQQISMILNTEAISITQHVPDIPKGIANIIVRAIEREVADRYATAGEMREALLPFTKRTRRST
ncbi:protein kinase domain-containing protein [Fuerstiella marisgermanici]|uniref:Serine/threonine-protein kinase PrkC n=1 Tax=Fuerstiella marisgermanici TaxID=1891926 RepID=A0A1P8WNB1_9PLAN|nr:protein kinase [Fuerstiella marisgermanici]APZ95556.1 Serine/threonine-protein kinase PrkC [Fuerstiella marisgermanici]